MKFAIGYQLYKDESFVDAIIRNKDNISEVYFSMYNSPSGRGNSWSRGINGFDAKNVQQRELSMLRESGISTNLLLNATCYGKDALSRSFFMETGDMLEYCIENFGTVSVTTTSPIIAKFVKQNFDGISTRASVNMEIGTAQGMEYVKEYFDSFYMKREYNRDFEHIKSLKAWCDNNGKRMHLLANSGCLNNCSCHFFHDNIVAHENEISRMDNAFDFGGICKEYLSVEENLKKLPEITNFVRPEDIGLYEEYFEAAKLATRVSNNPARTLESYIRGRYSGNILDILEPNHNIYPYVLENGEELKLRKIDENILTYGDDNSCGGNCSSCREKSK